MAGLELLTTAPAQALEKAPDPSSTARANEKTKPDNAPSQEKATVAPDPNAARKSDKPTPQGSGSADCVSKDLKLVEAKTLKQFRDSVRLQLSGECAVAFENAARKVGNSLASSLFLDRVEMKGLAVSVEENTSGTMDLFFSLIRNSEDEDSRKSWDTVLAKQRLGYPMKLPVALAIGTDPSVIVADGERLVFTTVQGGEIMVVMVVSVGIAALLISFGLLLKGNALRDSWGGAYSLGKSQMAFWGLIVFLSFLGVWIITGTMERIPPQSLVLLGISGATGLAAVLIGNTKDAPADAAAKLNVEKTALSAKGAAKTAEDAQRIVQIDKDVLAIDTYIARKHVTLKDFFRDICDDGTGPSFHRVQVLIWTLLLGAVFVWSVTQVISMPEFPQTLLLLLGISNGTYLGFKFPEKV